MKRRVDVSALLSVAFAALFALSGCCPPETDGGSTPKPEKPAKNIILLIGDGMGPSQVTLGRLAGAGVHEGLELEKVPYVGIVKTAPANALVTDSAAAATAMSTGRKTKNGVIGQAPDGTDLEVMAEWCRKKKKAVGLVTTATVTHATPAGFAAHCPERKQESQVAESYLDSTVDVFFGGGLMYFPQALQTQFEARGWTFVRNRKDFLESPDSRLIGLFADRFMDFEIDRDHALQPSLEEMTLKALKVLAKSDNGFFLMVEGGRIDMACHAHDAATMWNDIIAFDTAVRAALNFAEHDGNTLVLITADHATGGLAITENVKIDRLHERTMSAEKMAREITDGKRPLADVLRDGGAFEVTPAMLARIEDERKMPESLPGASEDSKRFALQNAIGHVLSEASGVSFMPLEVAAVSGITKGHDGSDVAIYASGPHAADFTGVLDNTDVGTRMRRAMEAAK